MSEPKKDAPEPSMEEILSSIRRIIAEEDDVPPVRQQAAVAAPAVRPAPIDPPADDVLVLTDRIDEPRASSPAERAARPPRAEPVAVRPVEPARPVDPPLPSQPPAAPATTAAEPEQPMPEASPLVSNNVAAVSAAAFSKLARAAAPAASEGPLPISGMTVEQLLMSMLEPMLKDWFDKNLPAVVERIVEEEVKKLVRRAELQ
jgi:cell pole-organizing protein PopZ